LNLETIMFIGCGIEFGNNNIVKTGQFFGELFINRLQFLTVSAPRSVGFKENEFIAVQNHIVKWVSDNHFDSLVVSFWNGVRFKVSLQFSINESLQIGLHGGMGSGVDFILGQISSFESQNSNFSLVTWSNSNILRKSGSQISGNGRVRKENFILVLFGELFEIFQSSIFIIRKINHDNWSLSENSFSGTLIKFENNWISDGLEKLLESRQVLQLIQNQKFISIIELSENNEAEFLVNFQFLFQFLRVSESKGNVFIIEGESLEFFQSWSFTFIEAQKNGQILFLEFF